MPKVENEKLDDKKDELAGKPETISIDNANDQRRAGSPLTVVSVILIFFLALFAVGGTMMFVRSSIISNRRDVITTVRPIRSRMHGMMFARSSSSDSTNDTVSSGVVTSVSGSSFVVAGNGSQITVNTSGSTTWNTTDKKVKTNDSVIVEGTKSNGTITATDVSIINR